MLFELIITSSQLAISILKEVAVQRTFRYSTGTRMEFGAGLC